MQALNPYDFLLTMAEVAVAFAGFASLIAVLGIRQLSRSFDLLRYWIMLEFSLLALALAILPLVAISLGAAEGATWRWLSGFLALFVVGHHMALARLYLRGNQTVRASATVASLAPAMTVYAAILLSQVANAAGLLAPSFGWYALGLVLVLVVTAAHFVIFIAHAVTAWRDRG